MLVLRSRFNPQTVITLHALHPLGFAAHSPPVNEGPTLGTYGGGLG